MRGRVVKRYSVAFKRQVIADVQAGRFASLGEARLHYGIDGSSTIQRWLGRYWQHDLLTKVVRVQKPDEADQIRQLKQQIAQLERVLGRTQAHCALEEEYLRLACEQLGQEVAAFKKKHVGGPSTVRSSEVD